MADNSTLSIIIPHYNSVDTLPKLINSIPIRDNIEIVIVDDGSTDYSVEYLRDFLSGISKDRNLRVITNDTGVKGPGGARNQGLAEACGEWILFADSDDSFVGDWYPHVEKYFDTDADIVYFSPTGINADTNEPSTRHLRYVDVVTNCANNTCLKTETEMKYSFCTPWSKLYRASVAKDNGLKFGDTMVSEDVYFVIQFARHSKIVKADTNVIYCVTRSSNTLTSAKKESDYDARIDVLIWRYNYLKDNLSKEEFKYTNTEWLALAKLADAVFDGWGIKKVFSVLKKYKAGKVKIFNRALFNPIVIYRNIEIELKLWREIKKKR